MFFFFAPSRLRVKNTLALSNLSGRFPQSPYVFSFFAPPRLRVKNTLALSNLSGRFPQSPYVFSFFAPSRLRVKNTLALSNLSGRFPQSPYVFSFFALSRLRVKNTLALSLSTRLPSPCALSALRPGTKKNPPSRTRCIFVKIRYSPRRSRPMSTGPG